jgi:hypothetical protein
MTRLIAFLLIFPFAAAMAASKPAPKAAPVVEDVKDAYWTAASILAKDFDGANLDDKTAAAAADNWRAFDTYVGRAGNQPLLPYVQALDPDLAAGATPLTDQLTLLTVNRLGIGHLDILQQGKVRATVGEPDCWRPVGHPCSIHWAGKLANDGEGNPRFIVDAGYGQVPAATSGHQLSFWVWKNDHIELLRSVDYTTFGEASGQGATLDGDVVRIGERQQWTHFTACASCAGRQIIHTLRITPSEVTDLGTAGQTPEMDALDALLSSKYDIVAQIRKSWPEGKPLLLSQSPQIDGVSMCVAPDGLPSLYFEIARNGVSVRFLSVQQRACAKGT